QVYAGREHEADHERSIDDLAEAELVKHLKGQSPHAGRFDVSIDADIDPRPYRPDKFQFDLIAGQVRFERLDCGEMAAGMITDGDLHAREVFRLGDRRIR